MTNNVNTPSYNMLPLLGVVNEIFVPPTTKKANVKSSMNKRLSKQ